MNTKKKEVLSETMNNYLTVAETAAIFKVTAATIYRWLDVGKLTPSHIAGRRYISISEIERVLNPEQ